jgi:hypothetical protein
LLGGTIRGGVSSGGDALTEERMQQPGGPNQDSEDAPVERATADETTRTRRSFLGSSGKKALYLTPIVLSLSARRAMAATKHSTP